jgi:hypothetical protein
MLVQRVLLLPPDAGNGWDGWRAQAACGQTLHSHPSPPPSQGEGSLCANLMVLFRGTDRVCVTTNPQCPHPVVTRLHAAFRLEEE